MLCGDRLPPAAQEALLADAEFARRGGVSLTREEWKGLAPIEQKAWILAGDRIAAAAARDHGLAASSPRAALAVGSKLDQGASLREFDRNEKTAALRLAAQSLSARYGGE